MATIHIKEIQKILASKGEADALPHQNNGEGYFLEIRFDGPALEGAKPVDEEYKNKIITVDCPHGTATIVFDEFGMLKALDLS